MIEFCTYTTDRNSDPIAVTRKEYEENGGLPNDWSDFIWHQASNKEDAKRSHDLRLDEYQAKEAGLSLKEYLEQY